MYFQQVTVPVMRKFHVQTIDNVSGQIVYVMAAVIVQIILMKKIVKVTRQLKIQETKWAINNEQSRETGNIGYTRHRTKTSKAKNKTQKKKKDEQYGPHQHVQH